MIKFDERCVVRTTYDIGRRINVAEEARGMWNVFCTTKEALRKDVLVLRDPRLPVAMIHPKGSISISGNHSIPYACESLKRIARMLKKAPLAAEGQPGRGCVFGVSYIAGRFRIGLETENAGRGEEAREAPEASYTNIQKWMDAGKTAPDGGWNISMIDILLSKKYEWCVKHGVTQVFSTKKASRKYELEMEMCKTSPPGAATFIFRMNEHGEFRYTILLTEAEFEVSNANGTIGGSEADNVERIQTEIDEAIKHLHDFIVSFSEDILVHCEKHKVSSMRSSDPFAFSES
ncbi:hypothetical protein XU18_0499 [Perkinsela sp. CCAP 1560/4]|nr:hypothetical protein XU18_0499 [Perkinsela sp. CCAP 1560/4]|eukprot:KNH09221.1 hypothetical protein XU18_0499 [Perkinsela sp. CCAP 1560/4]